MARRSLHSLAGTIGAHRQHALHGDTAGPARAAFMRRFEVEVDPDGVLPPDERRRRAASALRAYMARLALASAKTRRESTR